jgi:hypothetical protein
MATRKKKATRKSVPTQPEPTKTLLPVNIEGCEFKNIIQWDRNQTEALLVATKALADVVSIFKEQKIQMPAMINIEHVTGKITKCNLMGNEKGAAVSFKGE